MLTLLITTNGFCFHAWKVLAHGILKAAEQKICDFPRLVSLATQVRLVIAKEHCPPL